ncbi:MAG TPA: hypothetical protein VNZ26_19960 [Vicinamibacterales bacterium]|jgi:hypothetical protein|nr:hypothetical protein [Vicinamibacterales bacterium]
MDLAPDFDEFIASLIAQGVEFLIVGAYALALHGAPRFTGDLDVFVRPTRENASRLIDAVAAFGFPIAELRPEDIASDTRILQMGVEPVQIHVMSAISGVTWEEAWNNHLKGPLGHHEVAFLGRETFITNKKASARPKDLADIDALTPGGDE